MKIKRTKDLASQEATAVAAKLYQDHAFRDTSSLDAIEDLCQIHDILVRMIHRRVPTLEPPTIGEERTTAPVT
jgi:hypothetical protein